MGILASFVNQERDKALAEIRSSGVIHCERYHIKILWAPISEDNKLLGLAKEQARAATHEDAIPQAQISRMKSTTLNLARSQAATTKALPEDVGRHVKRVDAALPGKHTRQLQASVHADKQEKPWGIFSSGVGSGLRNGSHCYNVLEPSGAISPSAWAGNRLPTISNGRRTWRQYEPQYDLPSPRADSTPPNHVNQGNDTLWWFVSRTLKQVLSYVVMENDPKLADENASRTFVWTTAIVPRSNTRLMLRAQK
ncbi:hypothetical protein CBS147353_11186 [Aspergillus niger]|nr:hypothetical protein CBS147353_11186 [Aspergillus niger]